jgi:LDH2 family malate/lactate/ureidoglycolate dehydrogenase
MVRGPEAGQDGHFFLAINVAALEDAARFKTRVDAIVREIHASGRARGVERLYVPGELEVEPEALSRRNGIPLNAETLTGIAAAAQNAGAHAKALFYASPAGADSRK